MGYDRNDCWMTCGERDDKCAEMGLMDGPLTKDPFAEIAARQWRPIETAPNNVFDVLARYWDAGLDKFLVRRFIDCVKVDDEVFAASGDTQVKLTAMGFRPTHWMDIPEMPVNQQGTQEK